MELNWPINKALYNIFGLFMVYLVVSFSEPMIGNTAFLFSPKCIKVSRCYVYRSSFILRSTVKDCYQYIRPIIWVNYRLHLLFKKYFTYICMTTSGSSVQWSPIFCVTGIYIGAIFYQDYHYQNQFQCNHHWDLILAVIPGPDRGWSS